ncbi:MAG: indole-3-glycerol phosphate synthase TrpC [bacterium]
MILRKIIKNKEIEIVQRKKRISSERMKKDAYDLPKTNRGFKRAVSYPKGKIKLIGEIKKASPSEGIICTQFDPVSIAKIYESTNVAAISILTDEKFFQGSIQHLKNVKEVINIPILRKDFIIDEYQIYESKVAGADAILLIADCLSEEKINTFLDISKSLGLDCVVEVHNPNDLEKVLQTNAEIIGINNRNLYTFVVDLKTTFMLKLLIPKDKIVISESGIKTNEEVQLLQEKGIDAILVGTILMKSENIQDKIKELLNL